MADHCPNVELLLDVLLGLIHEECCFPASQGEGILSQHASATEAVLASSPPCLAV